MNVSFDAKLGDAIRAAAAARGQPLSSWLADAAVSKLRADALTSYLQEWEKQHGDLTANELTTAERDLGLG